MKGKGGCFNDKDLEAEGEGQPAPRRVRLAGVYVTEDYAGSSSRFSHMKVLSVVWCSSALSAKVDIVMCYIRI